MINIKETQPYYNKEYNTLYMNRVENDPIVLKVNEELKDVPVTIYLSTISKEDNDLLDKYLNNKLDGDGIRKLDYSIGGLINLEGVLMYDDGNKAHTSYGRFSTIFQKEERGRISVGMQSQSNIAFRNYEKSYEKWNDMSCIVNVCEDAKACWQSAIRKLGAKGVHGLENSHIPFYIVLWYNFDTNRTLKENGF